MAEPAAHLPSADRSRELKDRLFSVLDLTSLNEGDSPEFIRENLLPKATKGSLHVAAICINPDLVRTVHQESVNPEIKIATVVNFPSGEESLQTVLDQTIKAINDGADEIDMVLPWASLKSGKTEYCREFVSSVSRICKQHSAALKVILETAALTLDEVRLASQLCVDAGADFLKTSTGKLDIKDSLYSVTGATEEALREMLRDTPKSIGIKVSGGVKTLPQALRFYELAAEHFGEVNRENFRIGASSLVDLL